MRPFRFGVLAETSQTREQLLDTARRAEDAGYSTFLIRDHLVEGPFAHQLGPLAAMTAAAMATTRLRVGTMVLCNGFRHPAVLAKEIATLDQLSGGRVELGIGSGFLRREFDEAGLHFPAPGDRVGRVEEAIHALKGLFAPGPCTYRGRYYDLNGLDSFPKPVQQPHPPIHVGAGRPRMLSIAARHADIVGLLTVSTADGVMTDRPEGRSPQAVARQVARVRTAAAGRADDLELSIVATVMITDNARATAEEVARSRGWSGVSADQVQAMPMMFIGPEDRVAELLHQRRLEFGVSYFVVSDRSLETVAPVVAQMARG